MAPHIVIRGVPFTPSTLRVLGAKHVWIENKILTPVFDV